MKKLVNAVVLAILVMTMVIPGVASAGDIFHAKGKSASVYWGDFDEATGAWHETSLDVFQGTMQAPPGKPSKGTYLFGASWTYTPGENPEDMGTFEEHWFLFDQIPDADFKMDRLLTTATLNTNTSQGPVNVSWRSTGAAVRESGNFHYTDSNVKIHSTYSGRASDAVAQGSVIGHEMGESDWAGLYSGRSGDVMIGQF